MPCTRLSNVCVYNGRQYKRSVTWKDGCGVTCTCTDPVNNKYSCTDKCNKFEKVPANCAITKDADNCCDVATCYDPASLPTFQPPVTIISGVTISPDVQPSKSSTPVCRYNGQMLTEGQVYQDDNCRETCVCEDAANNYVSCVPRCMTYKANPSCELLPDPADPQCCQIPKCSAQDPLNPQGVTGGYTVVATPPTLAPPPTKPTSVPNEPTPVVVTLPRAGCYFKRRVYNQGEKWQDDCKNCECTDEVNNVYKCTSMCPSYPDLPPYCTYVYDSMNPCCKKPQCNVPAPPTQYPGQTTLIPPTPDYCMDKGVSHMEGDSWDEGCSSVLTCEDAASNAISKRDKCAKTQPPQPGCRLETDPRSPCCQILTCEEPNTNDPLKVVQGVPGKVTGSSKPPQSSNPLVPRTLGCFMKRRVYRQGESWDDGCSYRCTCEDEVTGDYSCDERCPPLPDLPSTCSLVVDPRDSCCQVASCTPPSDLVPDLVTVTPNPLNPGAPTVQMLAPPIKGVCLYKGQYLRRGQVYYDGDCDKVCTCEDVDNNLVRCRDVCAKIAPSAGCTLIPDPDNPTCCQVEECPLPPTLTPPSKPDYQRPPMNKPQVIYGSPAPMTIVGDGPRPVTTYTSCLYNGKSYKQGETWDDGCDFYCECVNATTATHRCNKRCPTVLPRAECVLAEDPNDPCCQTLFCDFVNPDPFPSGIPSTVKVIQPNKPQISSPYIIPGDPSSVVIVQPNAKTNPQLGFCLYNGAQYLQSQRWNVKCDQTCTCVNATSGVYSCVDRCPAYEPAAGCQLRTSPTDACCLVQDCGPNYLDPVFQVTPDPSKAPVTYKPDFVQPGEVAIRPGNPPTYIKTINSPVVPGASSDQIRIQRTKCIAEDGHFYSQGESWNTASERCVCIDAAANKAQCTQRCGDYYFLPNGCRMDVDPNNAPCRIAICPVSSMQSTVPYTPGPTITTQSTTNIVTAVQPYNPTCVYKDGTAYHRNEAWTDGCQSCRCVDPNGNNYQCTRSCPAIKDLPEYCVMVMDFANPCCQKVSCTKNGVSLTPLLVDPVTHTSPALDPSKTNVIPIVTHPVITGHGDPANVSPSVLRQYGGSNACVYKGRLYRPGKSWEDGCEQSCTCENNSRGMYTCIQICGLEPPVPSYCRKVRIPGQCCDTITCEIPKVGQYVPSSTISQLLPGVIPQLVPGDTTLTVLPNEAPTTTLTVPGGGYTVTDTQIQKITNRCVKDNKAYKQGETWQEGCDITCECIEEATGFYQCTHKCPIYDNAKAGCVLTIIPGQCCKRLICNDPDTGLTFDPILHPRDDYIVYGRYPEGFSGFRPYYVPSGVSTSFMGCYFNGKVYAEGQSWQDKCNYECTCLDGHKHTMQCKSMCYSYSHIPSACTLSASNNHCCQEVLCPTSLGGITPTPVMRPGLNISEGNCVDTISNCEDYTVEACGPNYAVWAKKYCPRFCGLCPNAPLQVLTCVDREKNCNAYGQAACSSPDTKMWMHRNCYRTCGYCNSCQDVDDACGQLNHLTCTGVWAPWARQMCAKTCNYCSSGSSSSTTGTTGSAAVPSGWMLLMKGVSGVPGDLYSLWSQTGGLNEDQALAKVLTNQYLGHYKSSLADSFGSCDFSKIRVGVYNNGVERGYVIFNAHGATKQNVFDPSRILSSTWNDVRSSSSHFSLPKSSTTGREFSLGKSQSSCSGQGWLFVSTSSSCSYESGANSFYFSPSTGAVEYKDMVQGDVIAVMAQGGSCTSQSVTSAQGCRYLNKYYKIGETWTEGCENDCQCIALNSTHTAVQCHNKCPQYKDVPKNCQMVKSPGSCCSTPVCSGCVDPKNPAKVYREGERWRDGCESDCTCLASSTISCQAVCLTMTLTPAQNATCTYPTPAPGKCCALPSCPGLIFQIPDANKKDY
ncbi:uncharacterized protein LOC101847773 [Aplysia californica]|uniref:Uncharacterized protein LOC101847773 n=1 Tax=Aplysia californica TaxID=6500 RepID=A0ABM1W2L1_APLCA|nr:uncharacterized protein LOC101847773 [Aplysia californica]